MGAIAAFPTNLGVSRKLKVTELDILPFTTEIFWLLPEEYMLKFGSDGSCGSGIFVSGPVTVTDSVRLSSSSTDCLFTEADIVNCADAGEAKKAIKAKKATKDTTGTKAEKEKKATKAFVPLVPLVPFIAFILPVLFRRFLVYQFFSGPRVEHFRLGSGLFLFFHHLKDALGILL